MSAKRIDLLGQRFGKLVVIGDVLPHVKGTHWRWIGKCDCGKTKEISSANLRHIKRGTQSCGCLIGSPKRPNEWMYNRLVKTCKQTKWTINLSYEEFLTFVEIKVCHYCDVDIPWQPFSTRTKNGCAYYLDRKDSFEGYSIENCVVCCSRCNLGKSNLFTHDQWVKIGKVIKTFCPNEIAPSKRYTSGIKS